MNRDTQLESLKEKLPQDTKLKITKPDGSFDLLSVTLLSGQGKTSVACKGTNYANDNFAVKFVPKARYKTHSIEGEFEKVRRLSQRFARILFYGSPSIVIENGEELLNDFYALVIEWVDGLSLRSFLRDANNIVYVKDMLSLCKQLTECLALLEFQGLVHNDLHDENILVSPKVEGPNLAKSWEVRIIDSGSIKSRALREELIEDWKVQLRTLASAGDEESTALKERSATLDWWIKWFSREDQEWIVSHFVSIFNQVLRHQHEFTVNYRRFLAELPKLLQRMVDRDRSMRLAQPGRMYDEIDSLWRRHATLETRIMVGPFDLISAELIRSPEQINKLFSGKTPWYEKCATTDPAYIYGPRGCGKSTILRKLALDSVLAEDDAKSAFEATPYIGVYLSCSAELRSRFWLFPDEEYDNVAGDAVEFFNLLLGEALAKAMTLLRDDQIEPVLQQTVGLTLTCEEQVATLFLKALQLEGGERRLSGVGWLEYVLKAIRIRRSAVWNLILNRGSRRIPNSSVIFDLCKDIEEAFPLFTIKHVAFLLDDYSNQRIPVKLQRILNQTISFAKQGNPIFKVSSEYLGVDLTGIQQGREVVEVNFGKEYVDLGDSDRTSFLEDVIDIRFRLCHDEANRSNHLTTSKLLGRQKLSAGTPMARRIREAAKHKKRQPFHYHGIDTVAEVCSGDIAMAIDIVREIHNRFESAGTKQTPVSNRLQHDIIREFSDHEHLHLRYLKHGKEIAHVIDRLCWLANKCAVEKDSKKDEKLEPMIKTSLDISNKARRLAPDETREILDEMIRRGCFFSLDTSRSRIAGEGTERYQIRRILLVKYLAPLARRDPIKIDRPEVLQMLLQDPEEFVRVELEKHR